MEKKHFLHFIGAKYYSPASFVKEALKYGASRRISLQQLKKMEFGDFVHCLIKTKKTESQYLGYFVVKGIGGLQPGIFQLILKEDEYEYIPPPPGGGAVKRGCGSYKIGGTAIVKDIPLSEITERLENLKNQGVDVGKLLVQGTFYPEEKNIVFKDIPHFQGFRLMDFEEFQRQVDAQKDKKKIIIRGLLYKDDWERERPQQTEGKLAETQDYERIDKELIEKYKTLPKTARWFKNELKRIRQLKKPEAKLERFNRLMTEWERSIKAERIKPQEIPQLIQEIERARAQIL